MNEELKNKLDDLEKLEEEKANITKEFIINAGLVALGAIGCSFIYGYLAGYNKGRQIKGEYLKGLIDGLNIGGKQ